MIETYGKNGNATLRDVLKLQQLIYDELGKIYNEITNLKIKVAMISSGVAIVISILMNLIFK